MNTMIFTFPNSSAIKTIVISDKDLSVVYNSSDTVYSFVTTEPTTVLEFLKNPGDASVGRQIAQWKKDGILTPVELEEPVAVW